MHGDCEIDQINHYEYESAQLLIQILTEGVIVKKFKKTWYQYQKQALDYWIVPLTKI